MLTARPWAPLLTVAVLVLLAGCGAEETARVQKPNIVLISIEATRPDHMSVHGYERRTTAFIDSLASEGVAFERAYSVSSWTVPSVASLVTGTYPAAHGVEHGVVQKGRSREIEGQEILSADLPHLARELKAAGYKTFGLTANGHLAKNLGYGEGFDFYRNLDFKAGSKLSAEEVNKDVGNWKGQIERAQPFFLWIHYFDPHDSYNPRKPWIETFYPDYLTGRSKYRRLSQATPGGLAQMGFAPDSPDHQCVEALYDSEISYADQGIREILAELKVGSQALVVVTSDHGEEFLDHGGFGHASSLYEEQIRVPLVVRLPGGKSRSVVQSSPVSLVDVAPTILDYLHLEIPAGMQGQSLMSLMSGRSRPVHDAIWATLDRPNKKLSAVVAGDWKLILDHGREDRPLLFHLVQDPGEQVNLAADNPDKVAELQVKLDTLNRTFGSDRKARLNTEGLSEAEIEKLRSMGYVR